MTDTQLNIDFFKQFIANNPGVLEKAGFKQAGRPKGSKNAKTKTEIQVPNGLIRHENGEVVKNLELSKKATKELVEQIMPKKKRQYKDPATAEKMKQVLLDNRQKSYEARVKAKEDKMKEQEANTTTIKIKAPSKKGPRSFQRPDEEVKKEVTEQPSTDDEEEEFVRVKKKLEKKRSIIDEIDNELKKLPPITASSSQVGKYGKYLSGW